MKHVVHICKIAWPRIYLFLHIRVLFVDAIQFKRSFKRSASNLLILKSVQQVISGKIYAHLAIIGCPYINNVIVVYTHTSCTVNWLNCTCATGVKMEKYMRKI